MAALKQGKSGPAEVVMETAARTAKAVVAARNALLGG